MSNFDDLLNNLSKEDQELFKLLAKKKGFNQFQEQDLPKNLENPSGLTPSQENLWFLDYFHSSSNAYNIPFKILITGNLQIEILKKSLEALTRTQKTLRTIFIKQDNRVVQKILDPVEIALPLVDIRSYSAENKDQQIESAYHQEAQRAFDLSQGPLINTELFRLEDEKYLLLINAHHIICDGWSMDIIIKELSKYYEVITDGGSSAGIEEGVQYVDFASWQIEFFKSEEFKKQEQYWMTQLTGELPIIKLPTDHPRPAVQSFNGKNLIFELDPDKLAGLNSLAQQLGVTLYILLLTVFKVLLFRYSSQDEILVGTPEAGRKRVEFEKTVGMFVNMLVLRTRVPEESTFVQLLEIVKQTTVEALENKDMPYGHLVKKLVSNRDISYNPLFQVTFNMLNFNVEEDPTLLASDVTFNPRPLESVGAQFDLALHVTMEGKRLRFILNYNTDLFKESTIERMQGHFKQLVNSVLENPHTLVTDLTIIPEQERSLINQWNETDVPYPCENTLMGMFESQVKRTPDNIAIEFEGQSLTYQELNIKANQLARKLLKSGIKPEQIVGVILDRSLELVVAIYGILKAGGAYLPIDPEYPEDRINFMIEDASLDLVITSNQFTEKIKEDNVSFFNLEPGAKNVDDETAENLEISANPEQLAYVIYTSGSTGKPKGVMIEHRSICNRLVWMQEEYQLMQEDRVLQKTPFSFDVSVWEFFWPLLFGARLVIAKPEGHKDSSYLIDLITASKITTIHFVPSMLKIFLQQQGVSECTSLQRVICSGEALEYETKEEFFSKLNCGFFNLYGPTEAAVDVTSWDCAKELDIKGVPIGKPIANTQTYILDERQQLAPIGVPGELYLGGVQVGRGYLNRPKLTEERFVTDPFRKSQDNRLYKTGDLVRYLDNGVIEYLGRNDFQVKIRGFRIELGEIEQALLTYGSIVKAAALARNDLPGGHQIVAYLVLNNLNYSEQDLRAHLKNTLPDYMIPGYFMVIDEFPISVNGKLDRHSLPVPDTTQLGNAEFIEPDGDIEVKIAKIWQDLLGIRKVGVDDNFFEVGGHSILMAQLQQKLKDQVAVEASLVDLFRYPTIRSFSSFVTQKESSSATIADVQKRVKKQRQNMFQKHRFRK